MEEEYCTAFARARIPATSVNIETVKKFGGMPVSVMTIP